MNLLLKERQLDYIEGHLRSKGLSFENLLQRIFSGQFEIQSLRYREADTSFFLCGQDLLTIYLGYQKSELTLPNKLVLYKHRYDECLHKNGERIVFGRTYRTQDITIKHFSCETDPGDTLAQHGVINSHQASYDIFKRQLFCTSEYKSFQEVGQVFATPSTKQDIDRSFVEVLKSTKASQTHVNVSKEINTLAYMASYDGVHGTCLMGMIVSSEKRIESYHEVINEVNESLPMGKLGPLIREDKRLMNFCMRVYQDKPKALTGRMAALFDYPTLLDFVVRKADYGLDAFQSFYPKAITKNKLNFVEKYMNRYEVMTYISMSRYKLDEVIDDLYQFRKQIKEYGDVFFVTLKNVCEQYQGERITPNVMYNSLSCLINEGEFKERFRHLNNPLDLSCLELNSNIKVKELITKFDLETESQQMNHCVGHHGYDGKIVSGQFRILSLEIAGERSTLELRVPRGMQKDISIVEHKAEYNAKPSKVSGKLARAIVKKLQNSGVKQLSLAS